MNGPQVVCAGCGSVTTVKKPVCDRCRGLSEELAEPICMLCEAGLPTDKWGQHVTSTGGYAGKCTITSSVPRSTGETT
jgi:hypothetical protein